MPLEPVTLAAPDLPLQPAAVALLEREAWAQRELRQRGWEQPAAGFIASDYPLAYATLHAICTGGLGRGWPRRFCEWGSGTGVVTILADMLGFDSVGIEVQQPLVALSRELAAEAGSQAQFVCGSFVPEGQRADAGMFFDNVGEDGHQLLGIEPGEVEIVYCYPWLGDEAATARLFESWASPGALLVTYHDGLSLELRVKT